MKSMGVNVVFNIDTNKSSDVAKLTSDINSVSQSYSDKNSSDHDGNKVSQKKKTKAQIIQDSQNAIVQIKTSSYNSPYVKTGKFIGTGFVCNKEKGLIVTNTHVIGGPVLGTYSVTFANGKTVQAKLKDYSLWQDFAILEVESDEIPKTANEIKLQQKSPTLHEDVLVIGNSEGQSMSFHDGHVSDIFDISGALPQHSCRISMNISGGASGSPILNYDGEAIGLLYSGGETFVNAVNINYIIDALNDLENGREPTRKHIGAVCDLYSLDKAKLYRGLSAESAEGYLKEFPDSKNKVLFVKSVINGTPAHGVLQNGDIIWEINDKKVNSNLYEFDKCLSESKDEVKLKIFRSGEFKDISLATYDVNQNKVKEAIDFVGALIFKADDCYAYSSGFKIGDLVVAKIKSSTPMDGVLGQSYDFCLMKFMGINGNEIKDLEGLKQYLASLTKEQKYFTFKYINHSKYYTGYDELVTYSDGLKICDVNADNSEYLYKEYRYVGDGILA